MRLVEGTDSRPVVAPAESTSVENLAMTTDDGIDVGEVHISDGHPSVVVVTVDYLISDGNYAVEVSSPKRADAEIGRIAVEDGRGSWGGTTRLPPEGKISLVGGDGDRALLGDAPDGLSRQQLLPEELQHAVEGDARGMPGLVLELVREHRVGLLREAVRVAGRAVDLDRDERVAELAAQRLEALAGARTGLR